MSRQQMREYNVDMIIDDRVVQGEAQYKIKWDGFGEEYATWEPASNITGGLDELIAEYLARKSGALDHQDPQGRRSARSRARETKGERRAMSASQSPAVRRRNKVKAEEEEAVVVEAPKSTVKKTTKSSASSAATAAATATETPVRERSRTPGRKPKTVATPAATHDAASASSSSSSSSSATAAVSSIASPSKSSSTSNAVSAVAQSNLSAESTVPVLACSIFLSVVINLGMTYYCQAKDANHWFSAAAFLGSFMSSMMWRQHVDNDVKQPEAATLIASNWSHFIHAIVTLSVMQWLHSVLPIAQGAKLNALCIAGSKLQETFVLIGFGHAVQDLLVFGANYTVWKLARVTLESVLYSSVLLCPVASGHRAQLIEFMLYVLFVFRVADFFIAGAQLMGRSSKIARPMYVTGVLCLLGGLFYFVSHMGGALTFDLKADRWFQQVNSLKASTFAALFFGTFFYVAPQESGLF